MALAIDSSKLIKPHLTEEQVRTIMKEGFGIEQISIVKELPSYDDLNFYIQTESLANSYDHNTQFVLKINNALEDRGALDLQRLAMNTMRSKGFAAPIVYQNKFFHTHMFEINITTLEPFEAASLTSDIENRPSLDVSYPVRLLSFLPGKLLADVKGSLELFEDVGRFIGGMDMSFAPLLQHPSAVREFMWDMKHTLAYRKHLDAVKSSERRNIAEQVLNLYEAKVIPLLESGKLRPGIIHGDCNDRNIIVDPATSKVTGIIDFGDCILSSVVFDIAIAAAYCALDYEEDDAAISNIAAVLKGFHSVYPLTQEELSIYLILIMGRLVMSALMSAKKQILYPNDEYLRVTEKPAWNFLSNYWPMDQDELLSRILKLSGV